MIAAILDSTGLLAVAIGSMAPLTQRLDRQPGAVTALRLAPFFSLLAVAWVRHRRRLSSR